LFLANQSNDSLDIVDVKNNQLIRQIPGQGTIHSVALARELDRLFVSNGEGTCNVFNATSYALIKSIRVPGADSVRFDPRTNHVFVAGRNSLTIIDAKTMEPITTIEMPGSPHGFQVAKSKPRVFVNGTTPPQVVVVDSDSNKIVAKYPTPAHSTGIGPLALDEANGRILVGLRAVPQLLVLDIESGRQIASSPIPEGADDLFYDQATSCIYATSNTGTISVIQQKNANEYESLATMTTVKGAKTSFYAPTLQRLFVAVPRLPDKDGPEIWVYARRK
jgi:hypothetical protein